MTITYHDHLLCFGPAPGMPLPQSEAWICCDDDNLDKCFSLLCEGNHVFIRNSHGMRHFRNFLQQRFQYVKAAGGRVAAPDGSCLLIHREGNWDLPKGMVEPGETLADAALREVREETGIPVVEIGRLLAKTYHIYDKYGGWHLKQTSWFAMHAGQAYPLNPQAEEGISQAMWIAESRANQLLRSSFASLRLLTDCLTR